MLAEVSPELDAATPGIEGILKTPVRIDLVRQIYVTRLVTNRATFRQ